MMDVQAQIKRFIDELQQAAGSSLTILSDHDSEEFKKHMERWSEIDHKTPAAIVLATSEEHVQETVRSAVRSKVPFVVKSGGYSTWSTIGSDGIILDLSEFWHLKVDPDEGTATIRGSVLSKQLSVALAENGLFTALGAGNSIGAIGYFLGGGTSPLNSVLGNGSDQILSARLVGATGEVIEVTEEKEPDLLYAIRGAGQYFGVITELTIQGHPLSKLGNSQGTIWAGRFVFPLERAEEVALRMQQISNDSSQATSGMVLIMAPPPDRKPCVVVSGRYLGEPSDADAAYKSLYDVRPLMTSGGSVPVQDMNDAHKVTEMKGGYTRYGVVGLQEFQPARFMKVVAQWKKLVEECPDANNTSFNFQWDSRLSAKPFESANSLHDTRLWQNNLLWYNSPDSQNAVNKRNDEANTTMRGPDTSKYVEFQNGTREGPIEYRFRPQSKLEKLKALKRKWDPTGIFTTVLLD